MTARQKLKIAVDGANGFIGVHVVQALTDRGHTVVALVRKDAPAEDVDVLRSVGGDPTPVSSDDHPALEKAMQGCNRLVHLIGSIAPPRGTRLEELHEDMADRFLLAARTAAVSKVVLISAVGAGPDAGSTYHRTKWQAEQRLWSSGLTGVVLRPSLVVGRCVGNRDSKMVKRFLNLIERKRRVPLVRGGQNWVQPIAVDDVAQAISKVLEQPDWDGTTLELGGDTMITTRQFLERLMKTVDRRKPLVNIPLPVAWCVATLMEQVQDVPLLSRDQLRIAKIDGICERNALIEDLGITPRPLDAAMAVYGSEQPNMR